jgi:Tol biopolymer transport system component
MDDLGDRFRSLDRIRVPDLWSEVETRASASDPAAPMTPSLRWRGAGSRAGTGADRPWTRRPVLIIALVALLIAALLMALAVGGRPGPRLVAVVAPSASVASSTPSATTAPAPSNPPATPAASIAYPVTAVPARNGLIAVVSAGRIHLVGPDGIERRTLGSADATDYDPVWSPDGSRLAFLSEPCHPVSDRCPEKTKSASLMVTNPDGSGRRELIGGLEDPVTVAWSPDGSRIAIDPFPGPKITVVSVADGRATTLAAGQFPIWTPDGSAIAYETAGVYGEDAIDLVNADGSGDHALVGRSASGRPEWPSVWTVDGSQLIYSFEQGIVPTNRRPWVVNRDGSDPHALTILGPGDFMSLSPDGQSVLWLQRSTVAGTSGHLFVTGVDPSAPRRMDFSAGESEQWSPDGTRLLGTTTDGHGLPSGLTIVDPTAAAATISIHVDTDALFGLSWQRLP